MSDAPNEANRAAEAAARSAYGKLVAALTSRTGDFAAAEDALADAFASAMATWPTRGVPSSPEAWLLTAARRKLIDAARRRQTAEASAPDLASRLEDASMDTVDPDMPDPRLGLLFLCAHPAIDASVRTPLMLQAVLGLDAARIASVFLVKPATMSARLVRAKAKIKAAGIPFGIPGQDAWPERLVAVLGAVYGAYTAGWDDAGTGDFGATSLASEAEWLARLLVDLVPGSGEAKGLLSLILFCEARRPARGASGGAYVPLSEQDTSLWDDALTGEANQLLRDAASCEDGGRFQLEAAIQSVHALRAVTGSTDHDTLLRLYDALLATAPSLGAAIARAAVLGEIGQPDAGLTALDALPDERVADHCPYHAARGHLLSLSGETAAAEKALRRAAELASDTAARDWLASRAAVLSQR